MTSAEKQYERVTTSFYAIVFGKSDAIMVEPSQLQRLHFIDKRLFTPRESGKVANDM